MTKQHHTTSTSAGAGSAAARVIEPVAEPAGPPDALAATTALGSAPEREQISRLAYSYWQARGCPEGSAEEDWLRAEAELANQAAAMKA